MTAVWDLARKENTHPQLRSALEADTVIIGAGITGLFLALKLCEAGHRVVVLEAYAVGSGTTGGSTGNLYANLSKGLSSIAAKWSQAVVNEVVGLRSQAMESLQQVVDKWQIDCNLKRTPLHFCVTEPEAALDKFLDTECDLSNAAGLSAHLIDSVAGLTKCQRALRLDQQLQCNPLALVQGLARAVTESGGLIFEHSAVTEIRAGDDLVFTAQGQVKAPAIVEATHTPKGINLLQAEMQVYREHAVAAKLPTASLADGIYWVQNDSVSLRHYEHDGSHYLIAVGQKHKTGEGDAGSGYYQHLRAYVQNLFPQADFQFEWSAQQYQAADLLPYIGRSGHHNTYVATGFAADGLTWGAVAAGIISNQILGRASRGEQLLDPRRFTPAKSAKNWAMENATVAKNLMKDYLGSESTDSLDTLAPGEGKLLKIDGEKLAVYRSPDNTVTAHSPVCPHLKCHVHWNGADSTWDCPCHGSRFATDGRVLEGPALEPLEPRDLPRQAE